MMNPRFQGEPTLDLSIILPIFEEEESIGLLIEQIHQALHDTQRSYEIICVDDGSRDQSIHVLKQQAQSDSCLVVVEFRRNFGQTAAMQAGLDLAQGRLIAFMDADLQNDPADLPMMCKKIEDEDLDLVVGWRADRKDAYLNRKLPSKIANWLIGKVTQVQLHDYGCSLKVMTFDLAKHIRLYGEMHRFIPAVASWTGARIEEVKVNHRARQFGVSKYGIGRTIRVILDLIVVFFMQSYLVKPMQVFGLGGLILSGSGGGICFYLVLQKYLYQATLADRPLLLLGILLIVVGIQFLSMGLMADLLSRTYHEAQNKPPYTIRSLVRGESPSTSESA